MLSSDRGKGWSNDLSVWILYKGCGDATVWSCSGVVGRR